MTKPLALQLMTLGAGLALAGTACTVSSMDTPSLTGPSELALAFHVTATPDSITQDGVSQSAIVVTARDSAGQAVVGLPFRLNLFVGGLAADYGALSGKTVVTGSDGTARALYTAPPAVPTGATIGSCRGLPGSCVTITATPLGTGFFAGNSIQGVDILLVPLGLILPPADTPTADFIVTPTPVLLGIPVIFDASLSCAGPVSGGACSSGNVIVSYDWSFGDGGSASGKTVSHAFTTASTFSVTLTVTNDGGKSASKTTTVAVGAGTPPTASFVFSPTPVTVGLKIYFDASASKAGPGHRIVEYIWNWGDGDPLVSRSGPLEDHDFNAPGSYTVVLTVVDEAGQRATVTATVTVT